MRYFMVGLAALLATVALAQSSVLINGTDTSSDGGIIRKVQVDSQGRIVTSSTSSSPVLPSDGGYTTGSTIVMPQTYQCGSSTNSVYVMDGGSIAVTSSSQRAYAVICNSRDNTSGNVRCRSDGLAASTSTGSPGTVLGVGDCVMFTNPPSLPVYCAGSSNYVSTFECGAVAASAPAESVAVDGGQLRAYLTMNALVSGGVLNSVDGGTGGSSTNGVFVAGKIGNALDFSTVATHTLSPNSIFSPGFAPLTGAWTFAFWLRASSPGYTSNAGPGLLADTQYEGIFLSGQNVMVCASNGGTCTVSTTALSWDTWTHVAVTYDGTNARIYVNGAYSGGATLTFLNGGFGVSSIGNWSNYWGLKGQIDELAMFTTQLNASEISYLYNSGSGRTWPLY